MMGHTHLPYIRFLKDGTSQVINAGSVGRSKEKQGLPSFAILDVDKLQIRSSIIRVPYDWQCAVTAIQKSAIPDFYAKFWHKTEESSSHDLG